MHKGGQGGYETALPQGIFFKKLVNMNLIKAEIGCC
jgi:hypothetical protein